MRTANARPVLFALLACGPPAPAWHPSLRIDAVLAHEIATVGRHLQPPVSDEGACLGVRGAVALAERLDDHVGRVRPADPDRVDAGVAELLRAVPGLRRRPADPSRVDVDWQALSTSVSPRASAPLLATMGDLFRERQGCWHPDEGADILRRLPTLWVATDECMRDLLVLRITDRVRADAEDACPGEDVQAAAGVLRELPAFRGPDAATCLQNR